jgi:probable addiction module antidote protein
MNTVFIGGSRHVSRLSAQVKERLNNVIGSGHHVIVGDANGADKAVQRHLIDASYDKVTVFCSGERYRNNLGRWQTRYVTTAKNMKGFQFYAAKDREMAREADFGLMIWDGKSVGTVLNVLRLIRAGKKAVLIDVPDKQTTTLKTPADWDDFISRCSPNFLADLRARATSQEWIPSEENLSDARESVRSSSEDLKPPANIGDELAADLNAALAAGDPATVVSVLGSIAKAHGMSRVAKDSGLARESLYRALSAGGNPEFATVLKVIASLGLRLVVSKAP